MSSKFEVILYCPQIPQNTGNIGRLCAYTNIRLHIIHPIGFEISDKHLRRSGMDYWNTLDVIEHESWDNFKESNYFPNKVWVFTTKSKKTFWDVKFEIGDGLLFGNEGKGLPDDIHNYFNDTRVTIPNWSNHRSINLATSVGIGMYEALRQIQ